MSQQLSVLPEGFEYRLELAGHVTPRLIKDQPVHNWFYFPHSFSPQLVDLLLENWHIRPGAVVLDPFMGAGTTLAAARARGISGVGADLSPLSVFVTNVKIRTYDLQVILSGSNALEEEITTYREVELARPERLGRAFTDAEYNTLVRLKQAIMVRPHVLRDFLLLALLRIQQRFSRAVPDGGWFRWRERPSSEEAILPAFRDQVAIMLADLDREPAVSGVWQAFEHDARHLENLKPLTPVLVDGCQAIVTSPPYPNRHDYSRIFQIELLTLGLTESEVFSLRHRSLRSNVEARSPEVPLPGFIPPLLLQETLYQLPRDADPRIAPMLIGYFEDMNAVLRSALNVLVLGGYIALVVGNVRHAGVMVPVDAILVEIGRQLGYQPQTSWVARLRGNSAQQMGKYGRLPARESVVILRKT